ncbi:AAA ATPase midasin, partial [Coemansia biformis]
MDTVEYGLERLELAAQKAGAGHSNNDADTEDDGGHNRASWEDAACITDVDPLSVDLPAAIAHMAGLVERIQAPPEAAPIVEQLVQWAAAPRTETVDEVLDRISALLLVEGLGQATTAPLQATHGPAEWADGQLTLAVAAVFRPLLVDLVARSTQPEAQAAVLRHLGLHADADRARLCVAYAAGCLLHTTPQIRSLLADYFGSGVGAAVVSQAQAAAGTDAALHALVVLYRLLRVLPGAAGSTEAPLAALMAPGLPDLARLVACECLCLARSLSDQGRSQLVATLQLDAAVEAHARAWLVRGEQMFAEAATAQMVEQNRIGLAQGLWQAMPSNRRDWMDASILSSSVADVGGVLLHAHGEAAAAAGAAADLVMTPTVARNVRAMALAASRGEPVLLQGAVGSGKTSLVEWMARRTGNELVTVHLSGSMDAKVLVGSYVTTQRAGDFEWRAGLLTTAVAEGKWMLIENVDLAPPDVIQTLLPLVESHTLFVASRGESIAAHARFRLFATLSAHGRSRRAGASGLLGSSTWSRLEMGSLEAEYPQIIAGAFPALADDAEALARAFRSVSELAECGGGGGKSAPPLSTRDLARWCARLSSDGRAGDAFRVFQEAIDTFAVREPDHDRWCTLVQRIGVVFGIPTQRADQFLAQHSPAVVATGRTLKIGRAVLATDGRPAGDGSGMPFADTRHARCLLERIAAAVQRTEPVLLVGETGTGKTTAVQRLASLAGRELSVFNLSQQSDASDLLGGFRPVDVARVALQLRETFDSLFARTLSVRKNAAFLDRARGAFGRRDWKRLAALYRAAVANARQMIASAQAAVAVAAAAADTGGGHGEAASEAPRAKRPRLVAEDVGVLEVAWDGFERRLADFEAVRSARLAFHFAEGALVRAARAGGWILLDEVNLAAAETLACLGGVLQRERALLLAETGVRVECHPEFRLFACMNPANDVGKRDLPPGLRSGFTEIFVHPPDANTDDLLAIVRAHLPASVPPQMCHRVIAFYRAAKALAAEHRLADGAGQRPHYSLRTLARSLTYAREHAAAYSLQRSLHDGLAMTFATQLEAATQAVLMRELAAVFDGSDVAQMLRRVPPGPPGAVLVQGFWLAVQDAEAAAAAAEDGSSFVVTASVETKLQALARAAMCGRYPVLIQGPTSAGKTSMVHHLARCTGHRL